MNKVTIDLDSLSHNIKVINGWMEKHGASWTAVTKVLCGHADTLKALQHLGIRSMGDSRLANLRAIDKIRPDLESWYLRVADLSSVNEVVRLTNVSLNSEIDVINALNEEAKKTDKIHRIVIMIELGDLREGILPGSLIKFYEDVFTLSHIEVIGIGANLGCLSGAVPNIDQFTQLALYHELLELKFKKKLPIVSAGSSAVLPLLLEGSLPKAINHFRIGEAIFLGTDLINDGTLAGLKNEAITLEAEIAEIKEKSLVPLAETSNLSPFDVNQNQEDFHPGQRGYRAIVSVGELDTEVSGLTPINPSYKIAGASSDVTVVNLGDDPGTLKVGDTLKVRLNYAALLRVMSGKYIDKEVVPSLASFEIQHQSNTINVEPILNEIFEK